ncbi:MAG TPA: hypothetical protein PKO33_16800, partial [Pyrinomonadaceae bacterium]|nr:hypothetical protein [Pyrinomonadaceae bacterium]
YDVEKSWIAPGFSSGFGYLETVAQSVNSSTDPGEYIWNTEIKPIGIAEPDGTRRALSCVSNTNYGGVYHCLTFGTSDGTYIRFDHVPWILNPNNSTTPNTSEYAEATFSTTYPNGTKIWYSGGVGEGTERRHYPIMIRDRNGNLIKITYKNDGTGRIDKIKDTLNREIKFYYENDGNGNPDKLVTVTVPDMSNNELQTVRFYYDTMSLQTGGFAGVSGAPTPQVTAPATIRVLKYVYFPATNSGFKYEYHPYYGMIRKISRLVGMSVSTNSTSTTGTLTEAEDVDPAATTEYSYPNLDGVSPQSDVPKYESRTDDWQGRTSQSAQVTDYEEYTEGGENVSRIITHDGENNANSVVTETRFGGSGLVSSTATLIPGQLDNILAKQTYTWTNRKLTTLVTTNEAGLSQR